MTEVEEEGATVTVVLETDVDDVTGADGDDGA